MTEQMDLFLTSESNYEEEQQIKEKQKNIALRIEHLRQERQEFLTKHLTPRQHRLVDYLKDNFQSGKYFSIEEICNADLGYELNKNPKIHDKCVSLGNDIRQINWAIGSRYSIIVKDKKGGCKLCESKDEFDSWKQSELAPLKRKWEYLNNLQYKANQDGTAPFVNLNGRVLEEDEIEFIDVFKGE